VVNPLRWLHLSQISSVPCAQLERTHYKALTFAWGWSICMCEIRLNMGSWSKQPDRIPIAWVHGHMGPEDHPIQPTESHTCLSMDLKTLYRSRLVRISPALPNVKPCEEWENAIQICQTQDTNYTKGGGLISFLRWVATESQKNLTSRICCIFCDCVQGATCKASLVIRPAESGFDPVIPSQLAGWPRIYYKYVPCSSLLSILTFTVNEGLSLRKLVLFLKQVTLKTEWLYYILLKLGLLWNWKFHTRTWSVIWENKNVYSSKL
jgi:hypothetical protein